MDYITFRNLNFCSYPYSSSRSYRNYKQACITFNNGYGVSVLFGEMFYSDGKSTYEVACIDANGCYYPEGTSFFERDVIGYATKEEVTKLMKEIQDLPNAKNPIIEGS